MRANEIGEKLMVIMAKQSLYVQIHNIITKIQTQIIFHCTKEPKQYLNDIHGTKHSQT